MKCDTYEPYSSNVGNELFSSFTIALKTFCETFPILFADSSSPFHSLFSWLLWPCAFNLESLVLIPGCTWFPSQISLRASVLINPSLESFHVDDSSIET